MGKADFLLSVDFLVVVEGIAERPSTSDFLNLHFYVFNSDAAVYCWEVCHLDLGYS